MKVVESHVDVGMSDEGRGRTAADAEFVYSGRRHALQSVPISKP